MMLEYIDELDSLRLKQSGGVYERQETRLIKQLLKPDHIFVDIGAHIGYHSSIAAQIVTCGEIIAYEPESENYDLLMKNLAQFPNVKAFNIAISNISGQCNLYLSKNNSGDHRAYESKREIAGIQKIRTITMDDSLSPIIKRVDFLKIDTQGFEIEILKGGENIIKNSHDINILIEYSPALLRLAGHSPGELIGLLIDWNFHIYQKDNGKWRYADTEIYHHKKGQFHTNLFCSRKRFSEIEWGC